MSSFETDLAARNAAVAQLVSLLARNQFEEAMQFAPRSSISAVQAREAIAEYGRTLVPLPEQALAEIDYIVYMGSNPCAWSAVVPLRTAEEGRSDLSLELTLVSTGAGAYEAQIDNIHVR